MLIICWKLSIQFYVLSLPQRYSVAFFSTFKKMLLHKFNSEKCDLKKKQNSDLFSECKNYFLLNCFILLTPLTEYTSLQLIQKASFIWSLLSNANLTGTVGLKVKDSFEICVPYHQTLLLTAQPPSSLQPSLSAQNSKKLSP